jgi:hypothetical protein
VDPITSRLHGIFGHFEEENFIDQLLSETSSLRLSPSVTSRIRQMAKVELRNVAEIGFQCR